MQTDTDDREHDVIAAPVEANGTRSCVSTRSTAAARCTTPAPGVTPPHRASKSAFDADDATVGATTRRAG